MFLQGHFSIIDDDSTNDQEKLVLWEFLLLFVEHVCVYVKTVVKCIEATPQNRRNALDPI